MKYLCFRKYADRARLVRTWRDMSKSSSFEGNKTGQHKSCSAKDIITNK